MIMNRIVKWAAAGVLTLGTLPAIGFARTRASLPSAVSVTPVGLASPASSKHLTKRVSSRSKHAQAKKSAHKKAVSHRKVVAKRHVTAKHARVHARSKQIHSKARNYKTSHARRSVSHKKTKHA